MLRRAIGVPRRLCRHPQVDARRCPLTAPTSPSLPIADFHMSTSNQKNNAFTNFTAIFEAASNKYKSLTGQDLRTHPLATELESRNGSPDSILGVFRKQAQALDKFRNGDDKLMKYLTPIVHILFTFSTAAGADIGLVSFVISLCQLYNTYFLVILARNGTIHGYWYSSRGESLPRFSGVYFQNIRLRW